MAEIINLNKARKSRDKAQAKLQAEQNRAAHGRTKLESQHAEAERSHRDQVLDGAKRERPGATADDPEPDATPADNDD